MGHRQRFGRQKLEDVVTLAPSTTTLTTPATFPRSDAISYSAEAPVRYGAPGPDDNINDGYAGDLPGVDSGNVGGAAGGNVDGYAQGQYGVGSGIGVVTVAAASDVTSGEGNDGNNDTNDGENSLSNNGDNIPPWCNPADPMGAWLNYEKIQVLSINVEQI